MPLFQPGSFTKNFGWNQHPPGLKRLYDVIRSGFSGASKNVERSQFRANSGLADPNRQLIPINFFLHNTVHNGANYVTADELVRHAINNPHSRRFDQLAVFALNLGRLGKRVGVAGNEKGAAFARHFVTNRLWDSGGWVSARLTESETEADFVNTIDAQGDDTVHKCVTNYLYIMEMTGLRGHKTPYINNHIDEWVGPGLFLAFDRYSIDRASTAPITSADLVDYVRTDELHKIMATTETYIESVAPTLATEYVLLGGLQRVSNPAVTVGSTPIVSSSSHAGTVPVGSATPPTWSDEDAEDAAIVLRRLQETQAQVRNSRHVRELKALYAHTCAFCSRQTVIGVDPPKYYSEAAHIKPVGLPHNGPDKKDNMLVLCPEHHLQFDRGLLRIQPDAAGNLRVRSKVPADPIHDNLVTVKAPHVVDLTSVTWHFEFWRS